MKEIFSMWRHTQMVVLVALSAAIYAAILIPFKPFPIIPGAVELRPANVVPFVVGILFGPAGAWGSAIGNTIGDYFGGTFSVGSIGGFVGNFFLALLPYKLWGAYFRRDENSEPNMDSGKKLAVYVAIAVLASLVCAAIISWWVGLLQIFPFTLVLILIVVNNAIMGVILGPILLRLIYPRVKRWGLLWTEIMEPDDVSAARAQRTGNVLVWVGGVGAVAAGLILSFIKATTTVFVGLALLPFLILVVVGTFMLGGREQVEAIHEEMSAEESRG